MKLNVTIEIPKHSNIKYEYDRATKEISVDRILYGANSYPQNYGFIRDALDYDGDELDALVIADQAFNPGINVPVRLLGAMKMIDGGETDTKLITVIDCDPRYQHIQTLQDVPAHYLKEIKDFFENYKNLQNKTVIINGFEDQAWAINEYQECQALMREYKNMDKDEFVALMRTKHPEKYTN
ncbi:inorganic diphosphatase [Ureaplasma sp. ES3154-GEN]|uniref:inorganic diphosphatase n=1 Tax=Ureaplasma sp. ES3154-GEN TaxID=2984844 RepID=UPI0021E87F80|nr:inorganic diphosphatase [Ureaplasma sp. ES3154-GEN]MCV3743704.1 inorganic diphosphatase [Ureaplasma sp. ES3154-GEN]